VIAATIISAHGNASQTWELKMKIFVLLLALFFSTLSNSPARAKDALAGHENLRGAQLEMSSLLTEPDGLESCSADNKDESLDNKSIHDTVLHDVNSAQSFGKTKGFVNKSENRVAVVRAVSSNSIADVIFLYWKGKVVRQYTYRCWSDADSF
jgi:hypothetical protein